MDAIPFGNYQLIPVNDRHIRIVHGNQTYEYESPFAVRLLAAIHMQRHNMFRTFHDLTDPSTRSKPNCDCFQMAAYLTGVEDRMRWPLHSEEGWGEGLQSRYRGTSIQGNLRDATQQLSFPIVMLGNRPHAAIVLAGTDEENCVIAQKRGSGPFELGEYHHFSHYFDYGAPITPRAFIGEERT